MKKIKLYAIPVFAATLGLAGFAALPTYASTVDTSGESIIINADDQKFAGDFVIDSENYDKLLAAVKEGKTDIQINGSIEDIRTVLTSFGSLAEDGEGGATALKAALGNTESLTLNVDGDTELVPEDFAYIKYLKGQAGISSLNLSVAVDGNVSFGEKTDSNPEIPVTIAEAINGLIDSLGGNGSISTTGLFILPEGVTTDTVDAFFGGITFWEGTRFQIGGVVYEYTGGEFVEVKANADDSSTATDGSKATSGLETPNTGVAKTQNFVQIIAAAIVGIGAVVASSFGLKKLNSKK